MSIRDHPRQSICTAITPSSLPSVCSVSSVVNPLKNPMPESQDSFFAIFSDVHANIGTLTAVLADIEQFPVMGMVCLGDTVGYSPEPAMCVQRVMDTCAISVLGNHEAMLSIADKIADEDWDISIRQPLQLANEQLTKAQKSWLHAQPITPMWTPSPPRLSQ